MHIPKLEEGYPERLYRHQQDQEKRAGNYVSAKKIEIREPYAEKQMNEIISHIKDLEQLRDRRLIMLMC